MKYKPEYAIMDRFSSWNDALPYASEGNEKLFAGLGPSVKPKFTYRSQGPGQLGKWDRRFISKTATSGNPLRKQILFCDATLKLNTLNPGLFPLLSHLLKDNEGILWEGPETDLSRARLITRTQELWAQKETIKPATEAEIKTHLARHQIPADQFLIFDFSTHQRFFGISPEKLSLNLCPLNTLEECELVLASIDPHVVIQLDLLSPRIQTIDFFLTNLPNLIYLNVESVSKDWLKKNNTYFANKGYKIIYRGNSAYLHKEHSITEKKQQNKSPADDKVHKVKPLEIRSRAEYKNLIDSGCAEKIEALSVESSEFIKLDPAEFPKLKWLKYIDQAHEETLFTLSDFPALEFCDLSIPLGDISVGECPRLTNLQIQRNARNIEFTTSLPSLKQLSVDSQLKAKQLQYLPELESLDCKLTHDGSEIALSGKIKFLMIDCEYLPPSCVIKTGESLRFLQIRTCDERKMVCNLENSKQLRYLDMGEGSTDGIEIQGLQACENLLSVRGAVKAELPDECIFIGDDKTQPKQISRNHPTGVSHYSYYKRLTVKVPDGKETIYDGTGQLTAVLSRSSQSLKVAEFRAMIYDQIIFEDDKVFFESIAKNPDLQFTPIQSCLEQKQPEKGNIEGVFAGTLQPGEVYPLPLSTPIQADSLHIYTESGSKVKVGYHYDPYQQHIFVCLLDPVSSPVKLHYDFSPNTNYFDSKYIPAQGPKLPLLLDAQLRTHLIDNPEFLDLQFLFQNNLSLAEKLDRLAEFCRNFHDEELKTSTQRGTLAAILAIIKEQRGICSQRGQVFMLLGRLIGANVQAVENEVHSYCEIRTEDGRWVRIDFRGRSNYKDAPGLNRDPKAFLRPIPKPAQREPNSYEVKIRADLEQRPVFNWSLLNADSPSALKSVLIYLPRDMTTYEARQRFFNRDQIPQPYVYIHDPEDFDRYLTTYKLQQGQLKTTPGPLQEILDEGGVIFINWSNFKPTEMQQYQSLWAGIPPRLYDRPVKKPLLIVGFMSEKTACPSGFTSAFQECTLPELPLELKTQHHITSPSQRPPIIADLYEAADWFEQLVANLEWTKNGSIQTDNALLQAINQKRPLEIYRPPADPGFDKLIKQIQTEGRFLFNGQWQQVPAEVSIKISNQAPSKLFSNTVPAFKCVKHDEKCAGTKIDLHLDNWYTLYEETQYVESKQSNSQLLPIFTKGKLEKNAKNPVFFYVTQDIPKNEWDRLTDFIRQKKIPRSYTFQLARGVAGPGIIPSAAELEIITDDKSSACYFSNDPAYAVEKLQKEAKTKEVVIIDVTPDMEVDDLLVKITPATGSVIGQPPGFTIEELVLLTDLQAGKIVILKGQLSASLLQALLPLLQGHSYIEINGKQIEIPGRVKLVQPLQAMADMPPILSYQQFNFTSQDYRQALLEEKIPGVPLQQQEEVVDQLLLFFKAADYPHRGRAMPADLGLCWQRLREMQEILLQKPGPHTHQHNPIKGLMLFNYEKNSEYYAFLNVLSKFLFDQNPSASPRIEKFQRWQREMLRTQSQSKSFAWRLLNTCDGATLRKILGETWLDNLKNREEKSQKLPAELTEIQWAEIYRSLQQKILSAEQTPQTDTKLDTGPEESLKLKDRLQYWIDNKTTKIIFLKGEPGVGKTHYLDELKKNPQYSCTDCSDKLDNILDWIENKSSGKKILLIDEANTFKKGQLDFLEGLNRNPPSIVYQGRRYDLTDQHIVVATGNPESFSGRWHHRLLTHAKTELVKMPSPEFLTNWLQTTYNIDAKIAEQIVAAAQLFKSYQPLTGYSYRNLLTVMQRYQVLGKDHLYDALYGEFGTILADTSKKPQFKQDLARILQLPATSPAVENKPGYFMVRRRLFPVEMTDAHTAIHQALLIRQQEQKSGKKIDYKRGVLLQGSAGIGKWTLSKSLLHELGFMPAPTREDNKKDNNGNYYFPVTAGESNFRQIATKAFRQGAVLLIKNLNLISPEDERFLGALLTGKDQNNAPAPRPGFLAIGWQKPSNEAGVNALSPALCNRMQIVHIPPYAVSSWQALASQDLGLKTTTEASQFVEGFWHPTKPYSRPMTGHDFFKYFLKYREINVEKLNACVVDITDEAARIKKIRKFLHGYELIAPIPLVKTKIIPNVRSDLTQPQHLKVKPTEIMALCLHRLLAKKQKLEKQCSNLRTLSCISNLFLPSVRGWELGIKTKKIKGLNDLINALLADMINPQKTVQEIVHQVVMNNPDLTAGFSSRETKSEIFDMLKFYDKDHYQLSQSHLFGYRSEIPGHTLR